MLKIPSWRSFADLGVTAFQDDTMFWKYYLIPDYVTIREDRNGKPVFLLIAYAFGDQDRAENKDLPRGGGFMVMDTQLAVNAADLPKITEQLQKDTDQMWNQLKALADAAHSDVRGYRISSDHKLNGQDFNLSLGVDDVLLGLHPDAPEAPPGDAPPKVIIADPTWCDGTFEVSAPQSPHLVLDAHNTGSLSLLGTNVAAVNLDLTSAGADFMFQSLVDLDGTGIDLTPIQVTYKMHFWARVPPVSVHATADSRNLFESIKSIYHDYEGNGCDDDSINHSEQTMSAAVSSGLIVIKTDKGDPDTPDDVVNQIRADAVKTIQQMLTERFFDKKPAPPAPADDPTKDFVNRDSDVYYLKSESSIDFTHFEYQEELSSVRKWDVRPQGTLQAFLSGLSPEEVKQYVRRVNLDDTFFQSLGLQVRVFGVDWSNDPIDFVEVELDYQGTDENGQQDRKTTTATFTKDITDFSWDPSLIGSKREYTYRWRVGYRGHGTSEWTDPKPATTNRLTFEVTTPGKVKLSVVAGNIDFANTTKSVQVKVTYEDAAHGVPKDGTTFVLDAATGQKSYERWIYVPATQEPTYQATFFLKNDQQVDIPAVGTVDDQVLVNEPRSDNRLDIRLVPVGDWSQVTQSVVSMRYGDPAHDINAEATYLIKTSEEYKTWSLYTAPGGPRTFQYQVVTSFKDGTSETRDWTDATGDQTLPITVKAPPVLDVTVIPALIDFTVTPVVEVTLAYDDPPNAVSERHTFAITKPDSLTWTLPIKDPTHRDFTVRTTYNTADGQVIEEPVEVSTDDKVTVQKLLIPSVSCLMVPKLIDFTVTPVVSVDLHYTDPAHGIDKTDSFLFTDATNQEWHLQIAEGGPRTFDVAVTYDLADGTVVTRDTVTLSAPKIAVPKYVPAG